MSSRNPSWKRLLLVLLLVSVELAVGSLAALGDGAWHAELPCTDDPLSRVDALINERGLDEKGARRSSIGVEDLYFFTLLYPEPVIERIEEVCPIQSWTELHATLCEADAPSCGNWLAAVMLRFLFALDGPFPWDLSCGTRAEELVFPRLEEVPERVAEELMLRGLPTDRIAMPTGVIDLVVKERGLFMSDTRPCELPTEEEYFLELLFEQNDRDLLLRPVGLRFTHNWVNMDNYLSGRSSLPVKGLVLRLLYELDGPWPKGWGLVTRDPPDPQYVQAPLPGATSFYDDWIPPTFEPVGPPPAGASTPPDVTGPLLVIERLDVQEVERSSWRVTYRVEIDVSNHGSERASGLECWVALETAAHGQFDFGRTRKVPCDAGWTCKFWLYLDAPRNDWAWVVVHTWSQNHPYVSGASKDFWTD